MKAFFGLNTDVFLLYREGDNNMKCDRSDTFYTLELSQEEVEKLLMYDHQDSMADAFHEIQEVLRLKYVTGTTTRPKSTFELIEIEMERRGLKHSGLLV